MKVFFADEKNKIISQIYRKCEYCKKHTFHTFRGTSIGYCLSCNICLNDYKMSNKEQVDVVKSIEESR